MNAFPREVVRSEADAPAFPFSDYFFPPFCDPANSVATQYDVINGFDPVRWGESQIWIGDAVQNAYDHSKLPRPAPEGTPPGIDLTSDYSVDVLAHHVVAHAVTGDVRHGVSHTRVIPYWDREAFRVGLEHTIADPTERQQRLESLDAFCINVLRTLSHYYVDRIGTPRAAAEYDYVEHWNNVVRIEAAMTKKKRSKESPLAEQRRTLQVELAAAQGMPDDHMIRIMDRTHAIAKLKQLLWLVDQQPSARVRGSLIQELVSLTDRALAAGITEEELALDMGADTGISRETLRPLYDITPFRQLAHLGADTYELPQDRCHIIPLHEWMESMDRPLDGPPAYERDGRYRLPFRFERRRVPRQIPGALTGLLLQN